MKPDVTIASNAAAANPVTANPVVANPVTVELRRPATRSWARKALSPIVAMEGISFQGSPERPCDVVFPDPRLTGQGHHAHWPADHKTGVGR
ncbi:hypothetical protein GCM10010435_61140 [Winogradskya consettensis]|uniref:Uncharacterized protein n=1 Tax=Winogradskya consettensis TaxID=113560 RepID=A0A919SRN3_9ACTN|nr:hypothetical protein Aco04nite_49420 [Actinoplanes consettensis]